MAMAATPAPAEPAKTAWHALTVEEALRGAAESSSRPACPTPRSQRAAPSTAQTSSPTRRRSRAGGCSLRQYADPMQIVLLGRGHREPVHSGPVRHRRRADRADAAQRVPWPEPGRQGRGERRRAAEDDGRQVARPPWRRGPGRRHGRARARRHRHGRGGRPGAGRRPDRPCGDPRDRRVGADRRERAGAQAGRAGGGRLGAGRPHRHARS